MKNKLIFDKLVLVLKYFIIPALIAVMVCITSALTNASQSDVTIKVKAPFDSKPKYPFTKKESLKCGRWRLGSQDYPYFGAPRDRNKRKHAGIDLYPITGEDTKVKSIKDGIVIKVAPFYTRANGEITYGILIDHGEFVANYAELRKPVIDVGLKVYQNQILGVLSGTQQLHFEIYRAGTKTWLFWYEERPSNLLDPTFMMLEAFGLEKI